MLIKNVDETLVNGSMGRVLRFVEPSLYGTEQDVHNEGHGKPEVLGGSTGTGGAPKKPRATPGAAEYPVVEFLLPHGGRRQMLVLPETWKIEAPNGDLQASRTQVSCR